MNIPIIKESRYDAAEKWAIYRKAIKEGNDDVRYKDLALIYYHLKAGRRVLDIHDAIRLGSIKSPGYPNLAIAKATAKNIFCRYYKNGNVRYLHDNRRWAPLKEDVDLTACLPSFQFETEKWRDSHTLTAPVPLIPPAVHPGKLKDNHYILWEVDKWEQVPPTDPYLLKRITSRIFIVMGSWDLTPIEKAVMAAHL
jgi:hypothetical protein